MGRKRNFTVWSISLVVSLLLGVSPGVAQVTPGLRSPADTMRVAALDASGLELEKKGKARYVRYLNISTLSLAEREEFYLVLCGHVQHISTASDRERPRVVEGSQGSLLRIYLSDYASDSKDLARLVGVWEKLADQDPYYHQRGKVVETKHAGQERYYWPGGFGKDGRHYQPGYYYRDVFTKHVGRVKSEQAGWLSQSAKHNNDLRFLLEVTYTRVPVVDGLWFMFWTAAQFRRGGAGYYDFLGIKTVKDYDDLIGFNLKLFEKRRVELRAAVSISSVTQEPRAIVRRGGIDGGKWATIDFALAILEKNPLEVLGRDIERVLEATEVIGFLPNDFIAWGLFNAAGVAQEKAPDDIAGHTLSPSTNKKVEVNISCMECHVKDGFRDIDDWVRPGISAGGNWIEPPKMTRLAKLLFKSDREQRLARQQYGRHLATFLERDRAVYRAAVKDATGLSVERYAELYAKYYRTYRDARVNLAWAERYTGVPQARIIKAIDRANLEVPFTDGKNIFGGSRLTINALADDTGRVFGIRQFEDIYPILQEILAKYGDEK